MVEDDPTLVTENFCLKVGKGGKGRGKWREGERKDPHCFLDKSNPGLGYFASSSACMANIACPTTWRSVLGDHIDTESATSLQLIYELKS